MTPNQTPRSKFDCPEPVEPEVLDQPFDLALYQLYWHKTKDWFDRLPKGGKILAASGAAFLALILLKSILQLISALFSLVALGAVIYGVYRFVIAASEPSQ